MQGLMHGKRGLIMGVANDHSIAWGIARTLAAHEAKLAFTYQGDALAKRVKPLAASVNADLVLPCDVEDIASVDAVFAELERIWGTLDFVVHAVAFSDKTQLTGRYADTTRDNFLRTMLISCFAFTEAAKRAAALMPNGGAMLTLTYKGQSTDVIVGPKVPVVAYVPGDSSLLKKGKTVVVFAQKNPDGSLTSATVAAEKNGVKPPM